MNHAIKLEDLELDQDKADLMVETFRDILLDLGFSSERIEPVSCRSYSGFIPYSHNKGGLLATCFTRNSSLYGSGYDYGDNIIQKWSDMQHDYYAKDHKGKLRYIDQVQSGKRLETELYQRVLEHYYEYIDGCGDYDASMFEVRFMVLDNGTVDVDVFGYTNDAPYFRGSDYNANKNFTFTSAEDFTSQVMEFLNTCDCVDLIEECY